MVKLNTLEGHGAKVGDVVQYHLFGKQATGGEREITSINKKGKYFANVNGSSEQYECANTRNWSMVRRASSAPVDSKPSGGPSAYYDFPFKNWVTVNDMIEYLSEKQWGKQSWIFKDIVKACTRWGSKDGTTYSYDAKKIIYYGSRLLMSVTDKPTLRAYLLELLNDKQFQENK